MNKRKLGNTGIELSEVGYGAAALFGKDVLGKQGISDEQAYSIVKSAISLGVSFFDTGINYGYAEERLGSCIANAIAEGITQRKDLIIETKCGETINPDGSFGKTDWSPDWIKKSLEISLQRLQLDNVDLYAMHGGSIEDCSDKLLYTFDDLKTQGLIRAYGINTFNTSVLEWVSKEKIFDYVMLDYNILRQDREPLIEQLYQNGVGVLAGTALGQSLYSKKFTLKRNEIWYFLRAFMKFKEMRKKSSEYSFLNSVPGYTANQLALRFVLDNQFITSAVFNTSNVSHLAENLKAVEIKMPDDIRNRIQSIH